MKKVMYLVTVIVIFFIVSNLNAQIKGRETPEVKPDTIFTYNSPRPLINREALRGDVNQAWGIELLLSDNGFGFGLFYQLRFSDDWFVFSSMYVSGARNTDELEIYDPYKYQVYVPDKINRLFMIPLNVGIQKYFLRDLLHENLKPFLNAGIGPTLIISTPYLNYENSFFSSFGEADSYGRLSAFIGGGANVGSGTTALISLNIRYYYIPFGGNGLESIKDSPINNFGGLFLSLSLGAKF